MAYQDLFREASAVAFSGRIVGIEPALSGKARIATNANLVAPGLSSALASGGGRSISRVASPVDFDIDGVGLGGVGGAETEVYDRQADDKLWIYARAQLQGLRLGIDTRLNVALAEAEIVSIFREGQEDPSFEMRRAIVSGAEFAGKPLHVTFWQDIPATHDELVAQLTSEGCKHRLIRQKDDYVEFHTVDSLTGPGEVDGHRIRLPNFGVVEFGVIQATEYSRRFILARFRLGSPGSGCGDSCDISSGAKG